MENDLPVCDVCGSPEVCFAERDVDEIPDDLGMYMTYRPGKRVRYGCKDHPPNEHRDLEQRRVILN